MTQVGKIILLVGLALIVLGAIVWALGKVGFRGLPGDIRYESDKVKVYVPIVTCLVISVVITIIVSVVRWLMK